VIGFVDSAPAMEPRGGGFLVTIKSGATETPFLFTLHALTVMCGAGMAKVQRAQDAQFVPTPYQRKRRAK
jgi:hypothetical protein